MGRDPTMVCSHLLSEFMALEPDLGFKSQHFIHPPVKQLRGVALFLKCHLRRQTP